MFESIGNKLFAWAAELAMAVGRAALIEATPVLMGEARSLADTIWYLADVELNAESDAERREAEADAKNVLLTAWLVLKQEGVLLSQDVEGLIASAAKLEIADAIGIS